MTTLATDTQELIPGLCRQFTQSTGWRLRFSRPEEPLTDHDHAALPNDANPAWFAEINDGYDLNGVLSLEPPEYGEAHLSFVQATDLAEMLAQLLARLATATRRVETGNRDVSTLVNLGMAVPAQDNLPWSLNQLLKAAVQLSGARGAAFFLLSSNLSQLRLRAVYQVTADEVPSATRDLASSRSDLAALAGEPVAMSAATAESVQDPQLPYGYRSALCVAVESETVPVGTLWVYDRRARAFSDRDREVVQSIAAQVAVVLERVALLRENRMQDRITRELKAASEGQPNPTQHALPHDQRYDVAAHVVSCYELGGDLCEVIPVSPDQIAIAIGDACGNSIPAALIMSAVRGALRTHSGDDRHVGHLMERLNHALYSITLAHQFMSLFYGVFDAAHRRFTYSNAGHPTPLLIRNGAVTFLNSHGLLLGVIGEVTYDSTVLELVPGDLLVFYSDGISEARCSDQQLFRAEGIAAAALRHSAGSAADVLDAIWSEVEQHIAGGEPADDRTLLVLKVR